VIALNPEWDHWFDEAFIDLVTGDDDLVQAEFAALIEAAWRPSPARPPQPPPTSRPPAEAG
jgi:hypothetical protein